MPSPTVVCVLRSGGEFRPEHVYALMAGVEDYWPVDRFPLRRVVLTDMPIEHTMLGGLEVMPLEYPYPGWWSKMEMFRPAMETLGDILFFDLDTVIVGDLVDIAAVGRLTLLADFFRETERTRLGSGMMYLPAEEREQVWRAWVRGDPRAHMRKYRGDQEFLAPTLLSAWQVSRWQDVLPGQVVSYKAHVKPAGGVPIGARVVCFHGRPRPWQLKGGLV